VRTTIGVKVKDSVSFLVKTDNDLTGVAQIENIATISTADTSRQTGICDPSADATCTDSPAPAVILVENKPVNLELVFPNVFTPNGDGLNEYFKIGGLESYTAPELYVYNRWGSQVYASTDYHNDWDGNGGKLNEGTYYYVLKVKTSSDEEKLYKGWVQILK
jgi:gliding motility-associated-like protein